MLRQLSDPDGLPDRRRMGKAARWLRGLLGGGGGKKDSEEAKPKEKRRWGFGKSSRRPPPEVENRRGGSYHEDPPCLSSDGGVGLAVVDPNKHAIAVAVATAAAAEAAVASAKAAAAVVRLTSSGRSSFVPASGARAEGKAAAVKIQAAFRGYLARRALRALRGLVKLQALVRGHIERKNVAEKLRCMQAIVRVQARARAIRAHKLDGLQLSKAFLFHPGPPTPEKHEVALRTGSSRHQTRSSSLKRNNSKSRKASHTDMARSHSSRNLLGQWMEEKSGILDDDKNAKILEVDPGKPHHNLKRAGRNFHQSSQSTVNSHSFTTLPDSPSKDSTTAQFSNPSPSSVEIQSLSPLRFSLEVDDSAFYTADNSPQLCSSSSRPGSARRGPFTPTKSDCSRSFLSGYSDYPNYMANTESSKAKARSQSAPKQRQPEFEKSGSTQRISVHGIADGVSVTSGCSQRSSLRAKFSSKAYPGSGRLDQLGMPIREIGGYNGTSRYRY